MALCEITRRKSYIVLPEDNQEIKDFVKAKTISLNVIIFPDEILVIEEKYTEEVKI